MEQCVVPVRPLPHPFHQGPADGAAAGMINIITRKAQDGEFMHETEVGASRTC